MSQQLNLYLTDEEYDLLLTVAERLGVTKAYVLRLCFRWPLGLPVGGAGMSDYAALTKLRLVHAQKLDE
jgi:hypothetical protein